MQIQEGVKVAFGGDAAGLLDAANLAKGGIAGLAVFAITKMAQMDQAARKTERQWQRSMTEISTLSNFTAREIANMRKEMTALSVEFGQAFDKMAKARYDVISAGFTGAAESASVMEAAAKGAVGGLTDIATSSKALISILNAYELEARDAARVNDLLFTTVQQGVTTYGELASEIGLVASTAKAANVPLEDLLALVATVTKGGIATNQAVTSINQFMMAFIRQTPEAKRIVKAFGLDLTDMAGTMEAISVMGDRDLAMLTKLIPSVEGLKAALAGAADEGKRFAETQSAMSGAPGAGDTAAAKMMTTNQHLVEQLDAIRVAREAAWGELQSGNDAVWLRTQIKINEALIETIDLMKQVNREAPAFNMSGAMAGSGPGLAMALRAGRARGSSSPGGLSPFSVPGSGVIDPTRTGGGVVAVDRAAALAANQLGRLALATEAFNAASGDRYKPTSDRSLYGRGGGYAGPDSGQPFNLGGGTGQYGQGITEGHRAGAWASSMISGGGSDPWAQAQRKVNQMQALGEATFGNLANLAQNTLGGALASAFGAGRSAFGAFAAAVLTDLSMIIAKTVVLRGIMSGLGLGGIAGMLGFAEGGLAHGYAWGGYTGGGRSVDKYKPAGVVHAGEYVLNQAATQRAGVANLDRLNRGTGDINVNLGGIHINGTSEKRAQDAGNAAAREVLGALRKINRTGSGRLAYGFGG